MADAAIGYEGHSFRNIPASLQPQLGFFLATGTLDGRQELQMTPRL